MASKHEELQQLGELIRGLTQETQNIIDSDAFTSNRFNTLIGNAGYILNNNNINNEYKLPDTPLNEVYPNAILPINVVSGKNYDDTIQVNLELLKSVSDRAKATSPSGTFIHEYLQRGHTLDSAIEQTRKVNQHFVIEQGGIFSTEQPQSRQELRERIDEITGLLGIVNSFAGLVNQTISELSRSISFTLAISPRFASGSEFGLNSVYDSDVLPTSVVSDNYRDTFDIDTDKLDGLFQDSLFLNQSRQDVISDYEEKLRLSRTEALDKLNSVQASVIGQQRLEEQEQQTFDIIARQSLVLLDNLRNNQDRLLLLINKLQGIRVQLPDAIDNVLQKIYLSNNPESELKRFFTSISEFVLNLDTIIPLPAGLEFFTDAYTSISNLPQGQELSFLLSGNYLYTSISTIESHITFFDRRPIEDTAPLADAFLLSLADIIGALDDLRKGNVSFNENPTDTEIMEANEIIEILATSIRQQLDMADISDETRTELLNRLDSITQS